MLEWKNLDEIDDFLGFMVVYCPNRFLPRHKMTLESAFEVLFASLTKCFAQMPSEQAAANARETAERSLAAYRRGDPAAGAELLQQVEKIIKGNRV